MRWPWTREPDHRQRGKLTLLFDHKVILGLPPDVPQDAVERCGDMLVRWLAGDRDSLLVFPFPVDVDDRRAAR